MAALAAVRLLDSHSHVLVRHELGHEDITSYMLSDTVVLVGGDLRRVLSEARRLYARVLVDARVLTRGAAVKGLVYHDNSILVGPAVVRAAQLEKQTCFPRIALDESLGDLEGIDSGAMANRCFKVCSDESGTYLDPMDAYKGLVLPSSVDQKRGSFLGAWDEVAQEHIQNADERVRDKAEWMARARGAQGDS